jgi:hypothetical protein
MAKRLMMPLDVQDLQELIVTGMRQSTCKLHDRIGVLECLESLDALPGLDLSLGHLIGLIAFSDCFEWNRELKETELLQRQLAYYLSKYICKQRDKEYLRKKCIICAHLASSRQGKHLNIKSNLVY